MSFNLSDSERNAYIRDYDALECKNLSLEEFIRTRREKELDEIRDIGKFETTLKTGCETMNAVDIPDIPPQNLLPRTIIVDGANVMHGGSTYHDERFTKGGVKIPDVAALLSIVRYFVIRNFEVIVVISRKYALRDATNFQMAIEELVKNHICIIAPKTNLDDTICLDLAAQCNGVVITSDKYRDHASESERYRRLVQENRLQIEWTAPSNSPNTRTQRFDDYVAGKRFYFGDSDVEMNSDAVSQRIYVGNYHKSYQITGERIALCQPEKKKQKILALLSNLIVDGLLICKETAKQINESPLPNTLKNSAEPDPIAPPITDFIADVPFEDPHRNQIASYDDDPIEW